MDTWDLADEIAELVMQQDAGDIEKETLTSQIADIINTHRENY